MAEEQVFTVVQVNNYLKHIIAAEVVLAGIQIQGEVADYKLSGGHAYFTLKDEGAELRCTYFGAAGAASQPANGDKVIVTGKVDFYIKRGQISFNVSKIRPFGLGDLFQKYLELKNRMEKEGYFAESHKKPIPKYPKRIGVVTSEKGAVIRDIINVARRRNPNVDIVLYPAKVQGIGAETEVVRGIEYFNRQSDVDTVIIARGGGSFEDLAPFYTEILAKKVYESKKPVISAIGHDTDFALTDFVADLRAPTPSAAAELAVPALSDMISGIRYYNQRMYSAVAQCYRENRRNFRNDISTIALKTKNLLNEGKNKIALLMKGAQRSMENRIGTGYTDVERCAGRIAASAETLFTAREHAFQVSANTLSNLNPMSLLNKGYAKISVSGAEIDSVTQAEIGSTVRVRMKDGALEATVTGRTEQKKRS